MLPNTNNLTRLGHSTIRPTSNHSTMSYDCIVCKWYESITLYVADLNGRCMLCYNAFILLHGDKVVQKYTSFFVTTTWQNAQIPPIIQILLVLL